MYTVKYWSWLRINQHLQSVNIAYSVVHLAVYGGDPIIYGGDPIIYGGDPIIKSLS